MREFSEWKDWLAVARIDTGTVAVTTTSLSKAASRLEPGYCHGVGSDKVEAMADAREEARRFREVTTCP